jgi:hypothetical protein
MGKAHKERQKDYRLRHGNEYREKENIRYRKYRKNLSDEERAIKREQGRLRSQRYYMKKRESRENASQSTTPYMSEGSQNRAINRVMKNVKAKMPHSPRKCAFVKLSVGRLLLGLSRNLPGTPVSRATALPIDVTQKVVAFYNEDDVSRMSPGQRDFVKEGDLQLQKVR